MHQFNARKSPAFLIQGELWCFVSDIGRRLWVLSEANTWLSWGGKLSVLTWGLTLRMSRDKRGLVTQDRGFFSEKLKKRKSKSMPNQSPLEFPLNASRVEENSP